MTPHAIAQVVAKLYTAAGRHYGKVELEVYAEALDDVDDEYGLKACRQVIREVDLGTRAPTPKDVLDAARLIRRRSEPSEPLPALPDVPCLSMEENARRMGEAVRRLRTKWESA